MPDKRQNPANDGNAHIREELEVSVKAGETIGLIRDAFLRTYADPSAKRAVHSLNLLCLRLFFCLYADDAGVFGHNGMFRNYMEKHTARQSRLALSRFFDVLDTKPENRDPYLEEENPELAAFPYVGGGLFSEDIDFPSFTDEIRDLLLDKVPAGFDWSKINPAIFGSVFESVLNPATRRRGGMHYTGIENIHKVIDPLFLDSLKAELSAIKALTDERAKRRKLADFQDRLSSLVFLDPACGSGNFLTEAYISLRRLENEVLSELAKGQISFADESTSPIKVSPAQFYGIEINGFAVLLARTALWMARHQMMRETETIVQTPPESLLVGTSANIVEGNALRADWEKAVSKDKLTYIMGNPPFVGARLMDAEQKKDANDIFRGWKNAGNLDYVCCWYKKAADMMRGTNIRTALVSTNSVSQGETVANLWKPLTESGVHIDFAHRTFRWESEASAKAHVHCVIIGFSTAPNPAPRVIYTNGRPQTVKRINGYLVDAGDVYIGGRNKPLCDVPEAGIGNKPIDGGNYLFTEEEKAEFVKKEPAAERYFRPWYGSYEFINRRPRYCLWLGDCTPAEIRGMPECLKRVEAVRRYRLASKSEGTRKLADRPTRFHVENMPGTDYLLIPRVSSERRGYVPIGFMHPDVLSGDSVHIIPDATLYHFGVLTSSVHMAWMRAVCGRLKSDYRYSKEVVYNNFPWPEPTAEQRERIEQTAGAVLEARKLHPDSSLADLYDETSMPPELRAAHRALDRAVTDAYGFDEKTATEPSCVAGLMEMYQKLVEGGR